MLKRAVLVGVPVLALVHFIAGVLWPPDVDPADLSDSIPLGSAAEALLRIVLTCCAVLTLLIGPGLWLRSRVGPHVLLRPAFVWIPGVLLLACTGLGAWLLASRLDTQVVSDALLVPVVVVLICAAVRSSPASLFEPGEAAACGLLVLLLVIGVAKATWSAGPEGELFGGLVSRTLEAGDRPDSRISYHVVQLVANGLHPLSKTGAGYFAPYNFSDRGPIAGLAAAPVVVGSGADPPLGQPDQPWAPFDRQGFAAYRIAVEAMSATIVLAVFGLLVTAFSRRVAWAGCLMIAGTPFVVHEVYFTWPKLLAASVGVAALVALLVRRSGAAGLLFGMSYLCHPVGLFVALAAVGVWLGYRWQARIDGRGVAWAKGVLRSILPVMAGMAVIAIGWRLANPGGFQQGDRFGSYLLEADALRGASVGEWIASRLRSIGNTLVPLELYIWDRDRIRLTLPTSGPGLISFLYWNTIPFAVGIVYYPLFIIGLLRYFRTNPAIAIGGVVAPFVVFAIYWGSYATGMAREGLQGWIVFALLAAMLGNRRAVRARRSSRVLQVCLASRGLEVLVVLTATTLIRGTVIDDGPFFVTDVVALTVMVGAVGLLMLMTWRAFAPKNVQHEPNSPQYLPVGNATSR